MWKGNLFLISAVAFLGAVGPSCGADLSDDCERHGRCAPGGSGGGAGTGGSSAGAGFGGGGSSGSSGKGGTGGSASGGSTSGNAGAGGSGGREPCDGACGGMMPVCHMDECVECTEEEDAACTGSTALCDPTTNTCVQCLEQPDCVAPEASRCDEGICVPCSNNSHCTDIDGKGVCDGGQCVECTAADESACGANSCNPATKQCTNTPRGSVAICRPCLADSECTGGDQADPTTRCVPMEFMGSPRPDGFCLRRAAKTCGRPYMIAISAPSLSDQPAENYCGIDQDNVRCEAVLDLIESRTCPGGADTLCGCARDGDGICTESGQGGLCRDFTLVDDRCTYQCGITDHCPVGTSCLGEPVSYCQ